MDEFQALLFKNTDLEGFQTSITEWGQADLLALINMAEAELTRQNTVDAVQAIESIGSALNHE
jgi:hypothetical protein